MSLKDTLQKKLETQTDSWSRQIDSPNKLKGRIDDWLSKCD